MAKKNTEVLNTNETEILEEKKDGEGVDTVVNPETGVNSQNPDGVEKNDTGGEQSNTGDDKDPKDTEQTGGDTGSDEVNQTGDDKKNPKGRGGKSQQNALDKNGKKCIQHTGLKNGRVIVFDGSFVEFDKDGIAEVDKKYAEFLLQIPGYKSVIKEAK